MLKELKNEANLTLTENSAVTYASSMSDCLDLFSTIGAMRAQSDDEILRRFVRAFTEEADLAVKILFYARDVRGGLGERRVFRVILKWLADNRPDVVRRNLTYIAEYGRYDDLLTLLGTPCEANMLSLVRTQLNADLAALADPMGEVSLLAKWLPSVNTSNAKAVADAKHIARALGMTDARYRKTLVKLRDRIRLLENSLREKDYTFDYAKQPSGAMFKYRRAFIRNDGDRYRDFLNRVQRGETVLHAGTLYPYEIVNSVLDAWFGMRPITPEEENALNATWAAMPDFGTEENALAVIDTSGSMYNGGNPAPASVALSLGLYFAEHSKGAFANHFIEFSAHPQLIELKGETFAERLRYISTFREVADTDLEAVFDLILAAAVRNHLPQSELPAKLYIISDMEFNCCVQNADRTNFENARASFAACGYTLPDIVFWNVESRKLQQPVTMNEQGVALVSGCTPRLFSMVLSGDLTPCKVMLEVLGSERYAPIAA